MATALRAKKPEHIVKRLKLFMFGPAGVGKTTAALNFPQAYVIDCERGTENYTRLIESTGGAVFQTNDFAEILAEVKTLLSVKHDYRTLVIDPVTTAYQALLEKCEGKVGSDFGRHYQCAAKEVKRLMNLVTALDMNVVITAHAKKEYAPGAAMQVTGQTFDAWKAVDHLFDLVVSLEKAKKKRQARVVKTRIETFEDEAVFEWSYAEVKRRYEAFAGVGIIDRAASAVALADAGQVGELRGLLEVVKVPEDVVEKWYTKAQVDRFEDMPAETVGKLIEYVRNRMKAPAGPVEQRVVPVGAE